jgi:hypothetical protein
MDRPKNSTLFPSCCSGNPYRRRRITWLLIIIFAAVFFFGAPWELPAYLKDIDTLSGSISRANIAKLVRPSGNVSEIYGLLHLVTAPGGPQLSHAAGVDANEPIDMAFYAGGDEHVDWEEEVITLDTLHPIVVFSKVRTDLPCRYVK